MSLMSDAVYKTPRYHFNTKAAYTFASRFYLFYQKPDSVIKYSTLALGNNPDGVMRDYGAMKACRQTTCSRGPCSMPRHRRLPTFC